MQPKGHIARLCQNSNRNKGKSHSSLRSQWRDSYKDQGQQTYGSGIYQCMRQSNYPWYTKATTI